MTTHELKNRTMAFALSIIKLVQTLPNNRISNTIANQIIRSGTSVGANYRAACRAKSNKDFLNKILIVEEESDETLYWLELLQESKLIPNPTIEPIMKECDELVAIFTSSGKTIRNKLNNSTIN